MDTNAVWVRCNAQDCPLQGHAIHIDDWNTRADSGEAVAYCEPDNPFNDKAFAWPGSKRDPLRHTMPLFTYPRATSVDVLNLQRFVGKMFEATDWPDGGDIDGFEFQRIAAECGLLAEVEMKEACGEFCQCLEMAVDFPATCYRPTQLYRDCKAAIAGREVEGKENG
jgi:hypothetical protein